MRNALTYCQLAENANFAVFLAKPLFREQHACSESVNRLKFCNEYLLSYKVFTVKRGDVALVGRNCILYKRLFQIALEQSLHILKYLLLNILFLHKFCSLKNWLLCGSLTHVLLDVEIRISLEHFRAEHLDAFERTYTLCLTNCKCFVCTA